MMDVSKLPRLSKTETPAQTDGRDVAPPATVPTNDARPPYPVDRAAIGVDVWIAVIVGLILMALGRTFAQYEIGRFTHQPYHTGVTWQQGPNEGQEVPYPQLDESFGLPYYSDSGLFLFGLALVIAGLAQLVGMTRLRIHGALTRLALLLVLAATAYNIFVSAKLFGVGITPVLSLLCVAFGGYEAFLQYRSLRPVPLAARSA